MRTVLWLGRAALFGVVTALSVGCAEERSAVNRVQANALAKSFFVGSNLASPLDDPEFYMRATVVDVGYGADGAGLYSSSPSPVSRVKWEITEDLLVGRLTHELIENADGHGSQTTNNGVVVAAFAVKGHFDIKRGYNPTTGEENNVIEENTADRPWFEREYFRVDWSTNLVTAAYDFDILSTMGINGGVDLQPLAYYVNDPANEDAPVFDTTASYFDVTNRLFASPRNIVTPWGQEIPSCYYRGEVAGGTYPVGNCNPTEVKIRLSWRKVVDTDFEPKDWNYDRFAKFGAFYKERRGYDGDYGVVDSKWHRFGQFYNIWEKSHVDLKCNVDELPEGVTDPNAPPITQAGDDPNRDGDADPAVHTDLDPRNDGWLPNGTEDECEEQQAPAGSKCDAISHKCTIPYAQRKTVAIPWHFGPTSDPALFDTTKAATAEWDLAVRRGVQAGRLTECRRTNGASVGAVDKGLCDAQFLQDDESVKAAVPEIIFLCHNPTDATDRPECGPTGTKARLGDLRYHFVNAHPTPQTGSPWGVMADGVDPLTGEKVQASINVWDSVTYSAATSAVDVLRWMNGELDEEDIKSGAYINKYAITGDLKQKNFDDFRTMTNKEAETRLRSLSRGPAEITAVPSDSVAGTPDEVMKLAASAYEGIYGPPVDRTPEIMGRYNAAVGSPIEAELTTRPMMEIAGLDPSLAVDDATLNFASPLRGNDFGRAIDLQKLRDQAYADRGWCSVEAPEPTAFVGLVKIMNEKFPMSPGCAEAPTDPLKCTDTDVYQRSVKMRDYLRKKLFYGVVLHEMGHSIGLRHNFVGSYDSFNFRPQYWQLRTHNGEVTEYCKDQVDDGATCVGPRWRDPMTQDETDGMLWMWQHTTVMDYPGDVTQDTLGLGSYDKAAARFFYSDTLDVWNDVEDRCPEGPETCTNARSEAVYSKLLSGSGGIAGPWTHETNAFKDFLHYSQFQNEFQLIRNCRDAEAVPPADWNAEADGNWNPVFDGHIVLGKVCDSPPVDYIDYRDLATPSREKDTGRMRWPHMFATDYSADIGNVAVLRHDNGADLYEQFNYLMNTYENRHIFDNFRRGRQSFSVRGAATRSMSRFHDKIRNIMQGFGLYHDYLLRGLTLASGADYFAGYEGTDGALKPNALAASMAFDYFVRQLTRPQPGVHGYPQKPTEVGGKVLINQDSELFTFPTTSLVLPEGSQQFGNGEFGFGARQMNNSLNNGDGSFDIQWLTSAGSYYDKVNATYNLTESTSRFLDVSLNDFIDGRYRNLSLVNLFPEGFRRVVATALTGDKWLLGPRVAAKGASAPDVDQNKWPTQPLGWTSWWPEAGPEACWPAHGTLICRDFPSQDPLDSVTPAFAIPVDPQVGLEVQKFIIFYSLLYLPANWKTDWIDQFRIYSVGADSVPDLPTENAVWYKDPETGILYIAKSYGKEDLFGKTVEKGIGARMLAWANTLTLAAYQTDPVTPVDPVTGKVNVLYANGEPLLKLGKTKCEDSAACIQVRNYRTLIDFARQTATTFGFPAPEPIGIDFN